MTRFPTRTLLAAAAAAATTGAASAAHVDYFRADLAPLNDSGVSGIVGFAYDDQAGTLQVDARVSGLTPNRPHPFHIHGLGTDAPAGAGDPLTLGEPVDSVTPQPSADSDGDGFIEVVEGLPAYGNILLPLQLEGGQGGFASADANGVYDFSEVFDLSAGGVLEDPLNPDLVIEPEFLFPLDFREVVIHGIELEAGQGIDSGRMPEGADGTAGYKPTLPVAAGEIFAANGPVPVPTPSAAAAGLALLGITAARRRREAA